MLITLKSDRIFINSWMTILFGPNNYWTLNIYVNEIKSDGIFINSWLTILFGPNNY